MKRHLLGAMLVAVLILSSPACKRSRSVCGKKRFEKEHVEKRLVPKRVEPRRDVHFPRVQKTEPKPRGLDVSRHEPRLYSKPNRVKTREEAYPEMRDNELAKELAALEAGLV